MSENIHSGHRQRQMEKFLAHGLDSFTDIEAIELLLFFALPRRDTNPLAHALLDRFKDLRGVLTADLDALQSVPGIGENAALLLRLVTELNCRFAEEGNEKRAVIKDSTAAGNYLMPYFAYRREECSVLLCMDVAGRVIQCHRLAEGGPGSVELAARTVVELALRDKADHVILAHNHISGVALPSGADIAVTKNLYYLLRTIDVELWDHIIVSEGDFVSLRDSGIFGQF